MKQFFLLVLIASFVGSCDERTDVSKPEPIKAVKTIVIEQSDGLGRRKISGVVKSSQEANLSFRVGGRLIGLDVDVGERVNAGQVLARLDQKDFEISAQSATANLQSARSDLSTKSEDLKRQKELVASGFVSAAALEKSQNAYQAALAQTTVAETAMQNAIDNLERTVLKAPYAGKIAEKRIDELAEVSPGQTIFVLQGDAGLEVEILIPETLVRDINLGDPVLTSFPTQPGINVAGVISEIAAKSESGNAYPAVVKLAQTEVDIRPDMTAEVQIQFSISQGEATYLIPTSAVDLRHFDRDAGTVRDQAPVYRVNEDTMTLEVLNLNILEVTGNRLVVGKGLQSGDRIVVAGVSFLSEGQKVKLWEPQYSVPATLDR